MKLSQSSFAPWLHENILFRYILLNFENNAPEPPEQLHQEAEQVRQVASATKRIRFKEHFSRLALAPLVTFAACATTVGLSYMSPLDPPPGRGLFPNMEDLGVRNPELAEVILKANETENQLPIHIYEKVTRSANGEEKKYVTLVGDFHDRTPRLHEYQTAFFSLFEHIGVENFKVSEFWFEDYFHNKEKERTRSEQNGAEIIRDGDLPASIGISQEQNPSSADALLTTIYDIEADYKASLTDKIAALYIQVLMNSRSLLGFSLIVPATLWIIGKEKLRASQKQLNSLAVAVLSFQIVAVSQQLHAGHIHGSYFDDSPFVALVNPYKKAYILSRNAAIAERISGLLAENANIDSLAVKLGNSHLHNSMKDYLKVEGFELIFTSNATYLDMRNHYQTHILNAK